MNLSKGEHTLTARYDVDSDYKDYTCYVVLNPVYRSKHSCTCNLVEEHTYVIESSKFNTCAEDGEIVYKCTVCGYKYTEKLLATGEHEYVSVSEGGQLTGICKWCGAEDIGAQNELNKWNYTLDDKNKIITLNFHNGAILNDKTPDIDIYVHSKYKVGNKVYSTRLANYGENETAAHLNSAGTMNIPDRYLFSYANSDAGILYKNGVRSVTLSPGLNTSNLYDIRGAFAGCHGLVSVDLGPNFYTGNVVNMQSLFNNCENLTNVNLEVIDTRSAENISGLIAGCSSLPNDVINKLNLQTENVKDMSYIFSGLSQATELPIDGIDTGKVTNMSGMFKNCTSLTDLDLYNLDMSNVSNMSEMFMGCTSLENLKMSDTNTFKCTDMSSMFENCTSIKNIPTEYIGTSYVGNFESMFEGCTALEELDLTSWSGSSATNLEYMFKNCTSLKYVTFGENFTARNVRYSSTLHDYHGFIGMFSGCTTIANLDLTMFTTTIEAEGTGLMFENCSNLENVSVRTGSFTNISSTAFNGCSISNVTYIE